MYRADVKLSGKVKLTEGNITKKMLLCNSKTIISTISLILIGAAVESTGENCETMPSEVHVTKEEYDGFGRLIRSCSGEIIFNKCEGMCHSQVKPSVESHTGFYKECHCCRETFLKERLVILAHCYASDGVRLEGTELATMEVRFREPSECKCFKCNEFSL